MNELAAIDSPSAHQCNAPREERWHAFEPISGRWSWLRVFLCCRQVYQEPVEDKGGAADQSSSREIRRAA